MARMIVCGNGGITIDIDGMAPWVTAALEDENAESVISCAVLLALSSLLQGDDWPSDAIESMTAFMAHMKEEVSATQLM